MEWEESNMVTNIMNWELDLHQSLMIKNGTNNFFGICDIMIINSFLHETCILVIFLMEKHQKEQVICDTSTGTN